MKHENEYYDARTPYLPSEGCTYENAGGGTYRCLWVSGEKNSTIMQNVMSKWTFVAFGIGRYPDGKIDWDHSANGYFDSTTKKNDNAPFSGTKFKYHGIDFIALGEEQNGVLAITAKTLHGKYKFDNKNRNNWNTSNLRQYLNYDYADKFDFDDLRKYSSSLVSDSGQDDYGVAVDYIFLPSCELYRKYRNVIPHYDSWIWTLTPWHIFPDRASHTRIITTAGSIYDCYANRYNSVAVACLFNPQCIKNIFE